MAKVNRSAWTDADDQFVIDNFSKMTKDNLAKHLQRSKETLYRHINQMRKEGRLPPSKRRTTEPKLKTKVEPAAVIYEINPTAEQLELIRKYHKTMKRTQLAKLVGIGKTELNFVLMSKDFELKDGSA